MSMIREMPVSQILTFWRPGSRDDLWEWADEYDDLIDSNPNLERRFLTEGAGFADHINPIHLGDDGRVWDGHHRICYAIKYGTPTLNVKIQGENVEETDNPPVRRYQLRGGPVAALQYTGHNRENMERFLAWTWRPVRFSAPEGAYMVRDDEGKYRVLPEDIFKSLFEPTPAEHSGEHMSLSCVLDRHDECGGRDCDCTCHKNQVTTPATPLTLDDYQDQARKTAVYPKDQAMNYLVAGLAGEVGELASLHAKVVRGDEMPDLLQNVEAEVGDILWFVAMLASELGVPFDDIARENIAKLQDRAERGVLKGSGDDR